MAGLAVKIDQVAVLREARKSSFPDPVAAALMAEEVLEPEPISSAAEVTADADVGSADVAPSNEAQEEAADQARETPAEPQVREETADTVAEPASEPSGHEDQE